MKLSMRISTQLVSFGLLIACHLILYTESIQDGSMSVTISTDPSGPTYPAASWIHVTCQITNYNETHTLTYTWIGACNATGERVFEITDPYLDSKGRSVMWILSTPHYCLDYLECHVLDTVTKDGSLASLLVNDVYDKKLTVGKCYVSMVPYQLDWSRKSGKSSYSVGVALQDQFLGSIPNNSIIITKSQVNLLCHSASKTACSGSWFAPGEDSPITGYASLVCTSPLYSYVNLTLQKNGEANGMYMCTIEDEQAVPMSIYIAIYNSTEEFEYAVEHVQVNLDYGRNDQLGEISFTCTMKGLPVTSTTWKKDGAITGEADNVKQVDMLIDQLTSSYSSDLTVCEGHINNLVNTTLTCDVYSNWVVTDQSSFGQQRVSGEFVIKKIGDMAVLDCVFPPNYHETEWILPNTLLEISTILSEAPNSARISFLVSDLLHKTSFSCQALTPKGNHVFKHYILIIYVPEDAISMEIREHSYSNKDSTTDQDHYNISCCVAVEVEGITSAPTVNWHNSFGEMISNGGHFHVQQTVMGNTYCTIFQFPSNECGDRLLCKATLFTDADSLSLTKAMRYSINRPTSIDISEEEQKEMSSETLVIIGASVTIILVAILSVIVTALSCAILSHYKKGRDEALGSDQQGSKKSEECYQAENIEIMEVKT